MKVSTKGRYALRLMLDLALNNTGDFIPIKDISERQCISIKYLEQIVNSLNKAGFLKSQRGASGGYCLAKQPFEYSIGDILRVSEGSLAPVACVIDQELLDCPHQVSCCATRELWVGLFDVVNNYLDNYTLQQLVDNHHKLKKLDCCTLSE